MREGGWEVGCEEWMRDRGGEVWMELGLRRFCRRDDNEFATFPSGELWHYCFCLLSVDVDAVGG